MSGINNTAIGRRMSFVELVENMIIEIPKIQRDYAQGRSTDKIDEIRTNFLDALIAYLEDGLTCHDLDFVYGSTPKGLTYSGNFIPLDGQQRLTTLFLLHWYLTAVNEANEDFRSLMLSSNDCGEIGKFTYQTRESSSLFCEALLKCELNPLKLEVKPELESEISQALKNEYWYFSSWEYDPTVSGMLKMLDTIHVKMSCKSSEQLKLFYERLFGLNSDDEGNRLFSITFQLLNIGDFHLTDDLYIKMNSRGVPLTDFEIFKSKIEQTLNQKNFFVEDVSRTLTLIESGKETTKVMLLPKYFSYQMDRDWANLFWKYAVENKENGTLLYDKQLMRFIRFIFVCTYSVHCILPSSRGLGRKPVNTAFDPLDMLLDTRIARQRVSETSLENLSFYQLREYGVFTPVAMEYLIDALDIMIAANPQDTSYEFDEGVFPISEIWNTLMNSDHFYDIDNVDVVRLFAYIAYLIQAKKVGADLMCQEMKEDFKRWMRIIHNVTVRTTTRLDNADRVAQAIWSISDLLSDTNTNMFSLIGDLPDDKIDLYCFDSSQMKEERLKARLCLDGKQKWETELVAGERNSYLNGQIGFLLNYAGAYDAFDIQSLSFLEDWDEKDCINTYLIYRNKVMNLFGTMMDSMDLLEEQGYDKDFFAEEALMERALLVHGDYLPYLDNSGRYTLANQPKSRDYSWRRMLTMNEGLKKCHEAFRFLLDFCKFSDKRDVIFELRSTIEDHQPLEGDASWREALIKCSEACRYGENGILVWDGEEQGSLKGIYLLNKSRWNSLHAELFSYCLYYYLLPHFSQEYQLTYRYAASYAENSEIGCELWQDMKDENNNSWYRIQYSYPDSKWYISYYPTNEDDVQQEGEDIIFGNKEEVKEFLIKKCKQ